MTEKDFTEYTGFGWYKQSRIPFDKFIKVLRLEWTTPTIKQITPEDLPSSMENGIL